MSASVLLPAPDSPIIPIKSPLLISNETFFIICFDGVYEKFMFFNDIFCVKLIFSLIE